MKAYALWVKSYDNGLWDEYITNAIYLKKEKAETHANRLNERYSHCDSEYLVRDIEIVE